MKKRRFWQLLSLCFLGVLSISIANANTPTHADLLPISVVITTPGAGQLITTSSTTLTGVGTAGSVLTIRLDGTVVATVMVDATGQWSMPLTGLTQGNHTVTVDAVVERPSRLYWAAMLDGQRPDTLYVTDPTSSATPLATISVGSDADGVTASRDGLRVYVSHEHGVDVIDTVSNTVLTTIDLAGHTHLGSIHPTRNELWVSQRDLNRIARVDTATNAVLGFVALAGEKPHDVVFAPDGSRAYSSNIENSISVIDGTSGAVLSTLPIGNNNRRLLINQDGSRLYIAAYGQNAVIVLDTSVQPPTVVTTIPLQSPVEDLVFKPDFSRLYASLPEASPPVIAVIDPATNARVTDETIRGSMTDIRDLAIDPWGTGEQLVGGNAGYSQVYSPITRGPIPDRQTVVADSFRIYDSDWARQRETATASVTFVVDLTADVGVHKTHAGDFVVGQEGIYTIAIINHGPAMMPAGTVVEDVVPVGLTVVAAQGTGWACAANGQTVTCTATAALPALATSTIQIAVIPQASVGDNVINHACITATNDVNPTNDCDDDLTTILHPALAIVKRSTPPNGTAVAAGNTITYFLDVTNTGTAPLTGVTVRDAIPEATAFIDADPAVAPVDGVLTWQLGDLAVGATRTVQFRVRVLPIGTTVAIRNVAHASSDQTVEQDSNEIIHPFDPTAITLLSMGSMVESQGIRISWVTGSEANTLGFQVYRGTSTNRGAATRITMALLPSKGSSGGDYTFLDTTASVGKFYYWIVELETDGTTTHDYGPVEANRYSAFMPLIHK